MQKTQNRGEGFTLLELMAVVTIIGILAAVAVPLLNKYLLKSKNSEATLNLRKIYDGEISYYQEEKTTNAGGVITKQFVDAGPSPNLPPKKDKRNGNFESGNWSLIRFGTDAPVLYSYTVLTGGIGATASFTARAEGDIDGDGLTSMFERVGSANSVSGEVEGGGAIYELDPLE